MKSIKLRLGLIFALGCINGLYNLTLGSLDLFPWQYFFAGISGVFSVWFIGLLGSEKIVRDAQIFQTIFIAIHGYGFFIYMIGLDPDSYDNMQFYLLMVQTLWIIWARHDIRGNNLYDHGNDKFFHFNFNMCMPFHREKNG